MNSLRLWILILAGTCFGAGLGAGVLLGEGHGAVAAAGSPSADYLRLFESTFQVSPERREVLVELLRCYDQEVEEIRQRALARSIDEVQDEVARVGLRYRDTIRNRVLPADERARFDELVAQGDTPQLVR